MSSNDWCHMQTFSRLFKFNRTTVVLLDDNYKRYAKKKHRSMLYNFEQESLPKAFLYS